MNGPFRCLLLAGITVIGGCGRGEPSFLTVTFCLTGPSDASELRRRLKEIGKQYGMMSGDRSAESEQELRSIKDSGIELNLDRFEPALNFRIWRDDGLSAGVGNLGIAPNQVAIGFGPGADAEESRRFAEKVIGDLNRKWKIVRVPAGQRVFPLKECGQSGDTNPVQSGDTNPVTGTTRE